jgi:hypothetical protein
MDGSANCERETLRLRRPLVLRAGEQRWPFDALPALPPGWRFIFEDDRDRALEFPILMRAPIKERLFR